MALRACLQWREGVPANRATQLEGLKHSPPLHPTHLTGTANGLRGQPFERPLTKTNQMADQKISLAASVTFFFFAHYTSGGFSVHRIVVLLLFYTLCKWQLRKSSARSAMFINVFAVNLTSANRNSPAPTVYIVKSYPA